MGDGRIIEFTPRSADSADARIVDTPDEPGDEDGWTRCRRWDVVMPGGCVRFVVNPDKRHWQVIYADELGIERVVRGRTEAERRFIDLVLTAVFGLSA